MENKYLGSTGLAKFLENLYNVFSPVGHSHTKSQITDFPTIPTEVSQLNNDSGYVTAADISDLEITVDAELSDSSENPVQNKTISHAINSIVSEIDSMNNIYTQDDEPTDAPDGSLWIDMDAEGSSSGEDGYSPIATVTQTDTGAVISITDKSGTTEAVVTNGRDGRDGQDGVSITHSWNGTTLTITSASGTSSTDLRGDKGDSGKTPVKGTDYWTDEDKAEIKVYVDEAILGGAW